MPFPLPNTSGIQRRPLLLGLLALLGGMAMTTTAQDSAVKPSDVRWTDIRQLRVEGKGWTETQAPFDRLPSKAEGKVTPAVWGLSHNASGMHLRFVTDARQISARWTLTSSSLAMYHMPATGVSGLDLYVKSPKGDWQWLAIGKPEGVTTSAKLVEGLPPGTREYLLYLPLYNGVTTVELGIPVGHSLEPAGAWGVGVRKPMLFYGTSIQQGACASRPGMVHSAILGRRFQFPHINLGFSGSGRMEPAMAELLAELDPSVYVLDCLPNMSGPEVTERVAPFVRTLRAAHPATPIVLVEDRSFADGFLVTKKREHNEASRAALRTTYTQLKAEGIKNLHYIPGASLLGEDNEGTVDSSHPNDLGFMRQADVMAKTLAPLLRKAARAKSE